jgi:hypothetical protein
MVDDILLLICSPPPTFDERRMNAMLFEALLIGQRPGTKEGTPLCCQSSPFHSRNSFSSVG